MSDTRDDEIKQFVADRDAAMMSLDEAKIRAYYAKYSVEKLPTDPEVFWGSVHKGITACKTLPVEFRRQSKAWLAERGWKSMDEGDL